MKITHYSIITKVAILLAILLIFGAALNARQFFTHQLALVQINVVFAPSLSNADQDRIIAEVGAKIVRRIPELHAVTIRISSSNSGDVETVIDRLARFHEVQSVTRDSLLNAD